MNNALSVLDKLFKIALTLIVVLILGSSLFTMMPAQLGFAQSGPVAEFGVNPDISVRGTAPLTVTFINSSTGASLYHWSFGDGTSSSVISPTHTFSQVGHYTVTLLITTTTGITDVEQKAAYVTVSPEPETPYVDLDKDGYVDLVVSNYRKDGSCNGCYSTESYIYWGSASGYDEANRTALPTLGSHANAVADLNNDGHLDIVFANLYNGSNYLDSYIYWGDGSRSAFNANNRTGLKNYRAGGVAVADLNQDGYLDIVFANYHDGDTWTPNYIYWGSSSGYSESHRQALYGHGNRAVDVGDLNEDGYLDIVFASYYDGDYATNSYIYWGSASGYSALDRSSLYTDMCIGVTERKTALAAAIAPACPPTGRGVWR